MIGRLDWSHFDMTYVLVATPAPFMLKQKGNLLSYYVDSWTYWNLRPMNKEEFLSLQTVDSKKEAIYQ